MQRVKRINENLVFVDCNELQYPVLQPWLARIFPTATCIACYYNDIYPERMMPPRTRPEYKNEDWSRYTLFRRQHVQLDDIVCIEEIAIADADPTIPTICFIQDMYIPFPNPNRTPPELEIISLQNGISMIDMKYLRSTHIKHLLNRIPNLKKIEIYCEQGKYTSVFPDRWGSCPVSVHTLSWEEVETSVAIVTDAHPIEPTSAFVQQPDEDYVRRKLWRKFNRENPSLPESMKEQVD